MARSKNNKKNRCDEGNMQISYQQNRGSYVQRSINWDNPGGYLRSGI
jgi:hypothetical protein